MSIYFFLTLILIVIASVLFFPYKRDRDDEEKTNEKLKNASDTLDTYLGLFAEVESLMIEYYGCKEIPRDEIPTRIYTIIERLKRYEKKDPEYCCFYDSNLHSDCNSNRNAEMCSSIKDESTRTAI